MGLTDAYPRKGEGNAQAFGRLIQRAEQQYWAELHSLFWAEVLEGLVVQSPDDDSARKKLLATWGQTVGRVTRRQFEGALEPLDADAKALERQALARQHFHHLLWWAVTPPEDRPQRKQQGKRAANHGG